MINKDISRSEEQLELKTFEDLYIFLSVQSTTLKTQTTHNSGAKLHFWVKLQKLFPTSPAALWNHPVGCLCSSFLVAPPLLLLVKTFMSSANRRTEFWTIEGGRTNRTGPRMFPCGVPLVTDSIWDS